MYWWVQCQVCSGRLHSRYSQQAQTTIPGQLSPPSWCRRAAAYATALSAPRWKAAPRRSEAVMHRRICDSQHHRDCAGKLRNIPSSRNPHCQHSVIVAWLLRRLANRCRKASTPVADTPLRVPPPVPLIVNRPLLMKWKAPPPSETPLP